VHDEGERLHLASLQQVPLLPRPERRSNGGEVTHVRGPRPARVSGRIGVALLVAGVAEVHHFPDRIVLVGLDQLTPAMP